MLGRIKAGGIGASASRGPVDAPLLNARAKSAKAFGVRSAGWPTILQAQALPNRPEIATTHGPRDRAILAVLLGCTLRRCAVAALTDGRCSGGFTLEATVAVRHANTAELSVE